MTIEEARPSDTDEIVKVLKKSLGDELLISRDTWEYKHINNPFGPSIVLLAKENGHIIGVRAFMKWNLLAGEKKLVTYRAVDTATHPGHRGKGIFKKLTLEAVKIAKEGGDDFIFNFPNEKSRPGYLKMGWEKVANVRVALKPAWTGIFNLNRPTANYEIKHKSKDGELEELCMAWNGKLEKKGEIFTPKSINFLKWRYEENPLQKYAVHSEPGVYLSGYVKKIKGFKELRITEFLTSGEKETEIIAKKVIKEWSKIFGSQVISVSPVQAFSAFPLIKGNFGPIMTVRQLNVSEEEKKKFFDFNNWSYSLGDLELF